MSSRNNTICAGSRIKSENVRLPEMLFGYFLGPFGAMLANGIFASQLQRYLTDVLQINLSFLSALQMVSTFLIVAANLIMGQLIERTGTVMGKARPWILLSAFTMSVSSVLMFVIPFEDPTARMVWIAVSYNLYYAVAFPIYNTANATLVPVSTRNSQQRAVLASFTNVAGLAVMGVGSMAFPILASMVLGTDQSRWLVAMIAVALFASLTIYLQFSFTRERVTEENLHSGSSGRKTVGVPLQRQLRSVTREKSWWIIILFYIGFQWSGALKNGSMAYFCQWVVDNSVFTPVVGDVSEAWGMSQSLLAILGAIPMAIAAAFVVPLSKKFTKRKVALAGMVIGSIGGVIAGLGNGNIVPVAIGVAMKCLGSAPACYLILAMLADVIDHIEFTSGIRTEGLTMSIYSALMVAGSPICNACFSWILKVFGYNQNAAAAGLGQSAAVQGAISACYIWVETIAYAICAVLIFFWTVEKDLPVEQKALKDRKAAA